MRSSSTRMVVVFTGSPLAGMVTLVATEVSDRRKRSLGLCMRGVNQDRSRYPSYESVVALRQTQADVDRSYGSCATTSAYRSASGGMRSAEDCCHWLGDSNLPSSPSIVLDKETTMSSSNGTEGQAGPSDGLQGETMQASRSEAASAARRGTPEGRYVGGSGKSLYRQVTDQQAQRS